MTENRVGWDIGTKFYAEDGEALVQVAQRSCGCPSLEMFNGQV